nr:Threonine--tRNA ligase [Haemophilus influenzae]
MLVCGDKEIAEGKVAVRTRKGADLGTFTVEEFAEILKNQVRSRELTLLNEE